MSVTPHPPEVQPPSRYVEKVSRRTGEVLAEEIHPRQLLVQYHRDFHVADVQARRMMSRIVRETGDTEEARRKMKRLRSIGFRASEVMARAFGSSDPTKFSMALFGLKEKEYFFRYKKTELEPEKAEWLMESLRRDAGRALEACRRDGRLRIRVLLTGGTGFVGQEILWQAAHDEDVAEVVALIRPKEIRDRKTGELLEVVSPEERGQRLLRRLWLDDPAVRAKFRFVAGDIEEPGLGLEAAEIERLTRRMTHVIHCAASVAFDDPYEASYRANVLGSINALRFSNTLQQASESPFVAHISIETSYIHGRQSRALASEDDVVFPRNYYNNYYELTKAMASIETERFMLDKGLRVVQLCPSIVIGDSGTGYNRGDTKVVNAPVNLFGRAQMALSQGEGTGRWFDRTRASWLARMACVFPGDPSAEINMIPVDWVSRGILAALKKPAAVGRRIHLATDNRITSGEILTIVGEELGVQVRLAEPTLHRNVTMPLLTRVLTSLRQPRIAQALHKLGTIFGGYTEWGQPVHQVGNDVRILGLPERRPETVPAFRMLCRHNRYVQEFGKIRDPDELSRRGALWRELVEEIETAAGAPAGKIPGTEFRRELMARLEPATFQRR